MMAFVFIVLVALLVRFGFLLIPIIPLTIYFKHKKEKRVKKADVVLLITSLILAGLVFLASNWLLLPFLSGMATE